MVREDERQSRRGQLLQGLLKVMVGASLSLQLRQLTLTLARGLGKQLLLTALSNTQLVVVSSLSKQLLSIQEILVHLTIAHAQRVDLEKVETAIRTLATGGMVQEYTIGGRNLKRYKMGELLQLRDNLKAEVDRERRAEKVRQGLGNPGVTRVRFI